MRAARTSSRRSRGSGKRSAHSSGGARPVEAGELGEELSGVPRVAGFGGDRVAEEGALEVRRVLRVREPPAAIVGKLADGRGAFPAGRRQQGIELGRGNQHAVLHPLRQFLVVARRVAVGGALHLRLELGHDRRVDARPQVAVVDGLADQVVRQRGAAAPFGRVVRVHVAADLVEGDHGGERARHRHRREGPGGRAGLEVRERLHRRRQVELVAQARPPGLEQDREVRELRNRGHQLLRLQAREP